MSPYTTPRLMGNVSDLLTLSSGVGTEVCVETVVYTVLNITLSLLDVSTSASALSIKRWLTDLNAAE